MMKLSKYYLLVLLLLVPFLTAGHLFSHIGWLGSVGFVVLMGLGGFIAGLIARR